MIWREKKWLVGVLVVLLVVNLAFFFAYRLRYEARITALNDALETARVELRESNARNRAAIDSFASRESTIEDLHRVYDEYWALRDERLAPLIIELQQMAKRSGLQPPSRSYNLDDFNERALAINGAESLTVSFAVKGSYEEVRNLVNLIELSRHFLIIDAIAISDSDSSGSNLSLNLSIRTVFKADERDLPEAARI